MTPNVTVPGWFGLGGALKIVSPQSLAMGRELWAWSFVFSGQEPVSWCLWEWTCRVCAEQLSIIHTNLPPVVSARDRAVKTH